MVSHLPQCGARHPSSWKKPLATEITEFTEKVQELNTKDAKAVKENL